MLPSTPNGETTSTEQRVFSLLSRVEWHSGSAGLASFNISEHEYKRWGEADFVLVGPNGLLVIEVKGGAVSCGEGAWRYESQRFGPVIRRESPYSQASTAFHALNRAIANKFGPAFAQTNGGFCVVFASMKTGQLEGMVGGPEAPREITGSGDDLVNEQVFLRFLKRVEAYWLTHGRRDRGWGQNEMKDVVQFLRPDFDRVPALSLRVQELREERFRLTEEQYYALDRMDEQPRLLVEGSAGCGKTFLAVEAARRESVQGRGVLFVTGTDHLAAYLRTVPELAGRVAVLAYSELASKSSGSKRYDVLIVDEGQQLTNRSSLDVLDQWVSGGLESGRWRWFADSNRQVASDSRYEPDAMELLRLMSSQQVPLFNNCRNTEQTITFAEQISALPIGRAIVRGRGPYVDVLKGRNPEQLISDAAIKIRELMEGQTQSRDVVLLHPASASEAQGVIIAIAAGLTAKPWDELSAMGSRVPSDWIGLSTIEGFRGLECEHVFIFGLQSVEDVEELQRLLYIGLTRATYSATICACLPVARRVSELLALGFRRGINNS